ncbi:MAG: hypothetical protein LUE11_13005 [Clostridia bacterium]|nr:hypothetical protein [Clostridia bacterium]
MNTYEVTLEFDAVTMTVEAEDEEEALDIAAERAGGCPDVDYFMSEVTLVKENPEEEESPLSGQCDLFGGEVE